MPNAVGFSFGIGFFLAGVMYLVLMTVFFYRYRQIRLRITVLRGLVPMLFAIMSLGQAFAIFEEEPVYSLGWYRIVIIGLIAVQGVNLIFITYVIYGRLHGITGMLVMLIAGLNLFLIYTNENFYVVLSPEFAAYYPELSEIAYVTNIFLGIIHLTYNLRANLRITRRHDIRKRTKLKFLLFTMGISATLIPLAVAAISVIVFQTGLYYFWNVVGFFVGLACIFVGLFYANPSVFYLPTQIYMLVVFRAGSQGEILYEKQFNPIQSVSAQLLGPALASIADLVQNSFQQSKNLRLFSLPGRNLLYEWVGNIGAALIVDKETVVFRNCLRLVLQQTSLLPAEKTKFDARVTEIFSFYVNEQRD